MLMEQQTVTNSAVIHGLCAMSFQSAMHCSLRLAPTMINHLTSILFQWTKQTFYDVVYSKIDDSLLFPEGEVESKAYQGKENPRCSQNGKDDSDGESYWHHHWIRNTIVWD